MLIRQAVSDYLFGDSERLNASGSEKPRLRQFCGTSDFLYGQNKKFRKYIEPLGYDYAYSECPGGHEWQLWDGWLPSAFDFFLNR